MSYQAGAVMAATPEPVSPCSLSSFKSKVNGSGILLREVEAQPRNNHPNVSLGNADVFELASLICTGVAKLYDIVTTFWSTHAAGHGSEGIRGFIATFLVDDPAVIQGITQDLESLAGFRRVHSWLNVTHCSSLGNCHEQRT